MDSGSLRKGNHRPTLTMKLSSTNTTLFHRWLLSTSPGTFVEHVNDIALYCTEANLKVRASLHSNNQQIHRLKHAVWSHGSKGGAAKHIRFSTLLQCLHRPDFLSLPSNNSRPHTSRESGNARSQPHRAATVVSTRWRSLSPRGH
jgi:hypothetical protein